MSPFPTIPLGELVENLDSRRIPLSSRERARRDGPYPYYGATGILDHLDDYIFEGLHLLIAEDGSVESASGAPVVQLVDGRFWVNNHAHVVRGRDEVDTRFLYYSLSTVPVRPFLSGSVQPKLNQRNLNRLEVPFPDRRSREEIVQHLGSLDDKIELNRQLNKTLEATARAIFKSWFVDFDPVRAKMDGRHPAGMSAETASLFPDSLDPSPLGQAPKNWKVSTLETLYPANPEVVITGPFGSALHASDYREEGVPLVLVKNVLDGRIVEDDTPLVGTHKVIELERYRLQRGDIVFTRVGAVGRTALVQPRQEGWLISGQLLRVRLPQQGPIHSRYLAQLYREPRFIAVVEARALGTTRPSLNTKLVRQLPLPVPPMQIQAAFAKTLNPLDAARDTNELEMQTLSKLRDTLLPKLIAA